MSPTKPPFAVLFKQLREYAGVSQSKLARMSGYGNSYVSRLESATRVPTFEAICRLSSAMNLSAKDQDRLLDAAGFRRLNSTYLSDCDPAVIALHQLLERLPDHVASEFSKAMRMLFATYSYETFEFGR